MLRCRADLVETADGRIMRRGMERVGVGIGKVKEPAVDVADLVHRLLALGLAGLDHERLVDDEREVHRGRVQAVVEHTLGKVERGPSAA